MLNFPPIPDWSSIHPLIVHLPIGTLIFAPLLMFIGLFPWRTTGIRWAALLLLAAGTIGCFVAIESGEAASDRREAEMTGSARQVATLHEELAEKTAILFSIVTFAYAGVLITQHFWIRSQRPVQHVAAHGMLLIVVMADELMIANVGHLGGRLVHQYDVRAAISQ